MNEHKRLMDIEFSLDKNLISVSLVRYGDGFLVKNLVSGKGQPLTDSGDIARLGGDIGNGIIDAINNAFALLGEEEGVTLHVQLHKGANIVQSAFGETVEPSNPFEYMVRVFTAITGSTPRYSGDEKGFNALIKDITDNFNVNKQDQVAFSLPRNPSPHGGGRGSIVDEEKTDRGSTKLT